MRILALEKLLYSAVILSGLAGSGQVYAQSSGGNTPLPISTQPSVSEVYNIGVLDPIADRMRAQGQRAESYGDYLIKFMQAQLLEQEVLRSKLRTRLERIQHFYEVRRIRWEEREIARDRVVEAKKSMEERRSDFLLNVPVSLQVAAGGTVLNDLLERMAMRSISEIQVTTAPISLPPNVLRDLRVIYGTGDHRATVKVTAADDPYVFDPPRYFRQGDYELRLNEYRQARAAMVARIRAGNEVSDADFNTVLASYEALERVFEKDFVSTAGKRFTTNTDPEYIRFNEGRKFLESQIQQIGLLGLTKELPKPFEGKTLQELVRYMTDYGYRFSQSAAGGENTYLALYQQMRDLYSKVAN